MGWNLLGSIREIRHFVNMAYLRFMEEFACAKNRFCLKVFIEAMVALSLERILAVGLLLALGLGSLGAEEGIDKLSEQEIEKLDELRLNYDLARGEIGIKEWVEPMEKLRKGYREKMQKVQDGFAEAKDLKKAIAARTAAKNDPAMASIESEVKEIADIQKIFIATQKKIQQRLDESLAKLARSYVSELSLIKIRLTKLNRLESAQVLEQMINQIKEGTRLYEPAELHSGQRNLFKDVIRPSELRASECRIKQLDQVIEIMNFKDPGYAKTPRHYAPPFRFHFKAMTDSTNIRWHYANGVVILGWEIDRDELRVHDPKSGRQSGYEERGLITPNAWHQITIEMKQTSLRIIVDGEERHQRQGSYSGLNAPIGIGGFPGTRLAVKEISIEKLR